MCSSLVVTCRELKDTSCRKHHPISWFRKTIQCSPKKKDMEIEDPQCVVRLIHVDESNSYTNHVDGAVESCWENIKKQVN